MSTKVLPSATSVGGQSRPAPITRREADTFLKERHPKLSRSTRERIAAAVPTIQRDQPEVDVWRWLDQRARFSLGHKPVFYRGHGADRTHDNAEAWNRAEWNRGGDDA